MAGVTTRRMTVARPIALVLCAALVVSCRKDEGQKIPLSGSATPAAAPGTTGTLPAGHPNVSQTPDPMSAAARPALDSGNAAFRSGDYRGALAAYRRAAANAPNSPAPYYGVYMAAQKLGDRALADSALAQVQARSSAKSKIWTDSMMKAAHTPKPKAPGTT